MRQLLVMLVAVAGCTKADPEPTAAPAPKTAPGVAFAQPPPTTPPSQPKAALDVKVELTAVTLADDCGGGRPGDGVPNLRNRGATRADMAQRRCEQTSMQLAITASAAAKIQIKSVQLLDESGASLGTLTASAPTRWSSATSTYDAWDETLAPNAAVGVRYVLQQPNWSAIGNRWNRTFTVKTVVSIGGVDRAAQKSVTLRAPATLPPNVRT